MRVHPAGCGCNELDCEYSRILDSFELKLLWALPASYKAALQWDASWRAMLEQQRDVIRQNGLPVPPCTPCADDPWVVLATITIPVGQSANGIAKPVMAPITAADISTSDRRVLLSTTALQVLTETLAGP